MENPTKISPDTETDGAVTEGKADGLFDHLKSPELAIQTCIGSVDTYQDGLPNNFHDALVVKDFYSEEVENIDFSSSCEMKKERQQLSDGGCTYVMSDINSKDKFSSGYFHCTGLVAVGTDKETGENISFGLHSPLYSKDTLNNPAFQKLESDLSANLDKLDQMSEEGTVDVVVFGGIVIEEIQQYANDREKYNFILNFYKDQVTTSLGFSPISVGGPKPDLEFLGTDNMYFDNKTRRLYLLRPKSAEKVSALSKKL